MFTVVCLLVCIPIALSMTHDEPLCGRAILQPYGFNMCRTFCRRVVGCRSFLYKAPDLRCQCETPVNSGGKFGSSYGIKKMEHGRIGCPNKSLVVRTKYSQFYCRKCTATHKQPSKLNRMSGKVCLKFLNRVISGYVDEVRRMVKKYEHHTCHIGQTKTNAIMLAARNARIPVFDLLRNHVYSLEDYDSIGNNILHNTVFSCDIDMVQHILMLKIVDLNSEGFDGYRPLMLSVLMCKNTMKLFHFLLKSGADLHADKSNGFNLLHAASCAGNMGVVTYIVNNNLLGINIKQRCGMTAYLYAVMLGQRNVMDFLISKKCDMTAIPVPRGLRRSCDQDLGTKEVLDLLGQEHVTDYGIPFIIAALDHNIEVFQYLRYRKACIIPNVLQYGCNKRMFTWLMIIQTHDIIVIDFRMSDNTTCFVSAVLSRTQVARQFLIQYGGVVTGPRFLLTLKKPVNPILK